MAVVSPALGSNAREFDQWQAGLLQRKRNLDSCHALAVHRENLVEHGSIGVEIGKVQLESAFKVEIIQIACLVLNTKCSVFYWLSLLMN